MNTRFKRREPINVFLFSIITFGLYYLYWMYHITKELNDVLCFGDESTPILDVLLCAFFSPYAIIWTNRTCQHIFIAQDRVGLNSPLNHSTAYTLMCIIGLGPLVAMKLQEDVNHIIESLDEP